MKSFSFQTANLFRRQWQERLAEVNTSPTLLPSVCSNLILLSSSAAVSSWAKRPQAFTANLQTRNQKLNLSDSSLHLLSSHVSPPFTLAWLLTRKVAEFSSLLHSHLVSLLGLLLNRSAPGVMCVIHQREASVWRAATCRSRHQQNGASRLFSNLHLDVFSWFLL